MSDLVSRLAADGRITLTLHIQPGAKKTEVAGLHGEALKIRLAAPPVDGKANEALIKFVAETLRLPKSAVSLKSGQTSRHKVLESSARRRPRWPNWRPNENGGQARRQPAVGSAYFFAVLAGAPPASPTVSSGRSLATLFSPNPLTPFKSSTDLNGPFFVR